MKTNRRRIMTGILLFLIFVVFALIMLRLVLYFKFTKEMSMRADFSSPNIKNAKVTIPGRPHWIPDYLTAPQDIKHRTTFTFSTNSHGLRGKEFSVKKSDGTFRIVCVGECVVFGNGVNDNEIYSARLEEILKDNYPDKKFEVINAGISGGSPDAVFELFKNKVVNYAPDLVIYSPGADTVFFPGHLGQSGAPVRVWLTDEEYGRSLKRYRDFMTRAIDMCKQSGFRIMLVTPTTNHFFLPDGQLYVDEVNKIAQERRIPYLDTTALFKKVEMEKGLVLIKEDGKDKLISIDGGKRNILMEADSPEDNIHFISPSIYEYLDSHQDVNPLLSVDENHPNARGHQLIAEELYKILVEEGIVGKTSGRD